METTAEGIEYMDQLQLIRSLRVSHVQGWIYSKAINSAELCERIANGDWVIEPVGPAKQRSARQAMFRKVGLIHSNRYDHVIVRNLSDSGALIDGIPGLQPGTLVVADFGDGQLAFARVIRTSGRQLGIAFEQPLVDDGNGGLCTSHRVSPYLLRTVGLPSAENPEEATAPAGNTMPLDELAKKLGVTLADPSENEGAISDIRGVNGRKSGAPGTTTFREMSERFLQGHEGDEQARESVRRDLRNHILPRFGQLSLDQISQSDVLAWLAAKSEDEDHPAGTDTRLFTLLSQMWAMAVKLKLPGADHNPLDGREFVATRAGTHSALTAAETRRLLEATRGGQNRQLKYILSLMMLTGARQGELLSARWDQFDLQAGAWKLPTESDGSAREIALTPAAIELLGELPRWSDCPYLLPNPVTRQPYRTIQRSWEVARISSGLRYMELNDLRYCNIGTDIPEADILSAVRQEASGPVDGGGSNQSPEDDDRGSVLAA
ncbi:MAG: tyrosine-type recombinase/integrase, partial [Allosphingosinicella sp.]